MPLCLLQVSDLTFQGKYKKRGREKKIVRDEKLFNKRDKNGWKKTQPPIYNKSAELSTADPGAISKSQIIAPYLRNHIEQLSAPEIGSSLSCALLSSLEMLFICDYRQPLNKRCLCLRSKVFSRFRTPQILQRGEDWRQNTLFRKGC